MDTKQRKSIIIRIVSVLVILLAGAIFFGVMHYVKVNKAYTAEELGITEIKSDTDADNDGIDDYTDLMLGAREYVETEPKYKSKYYEGGYPDDGYGVCTDVIWRAFMAAGYNLKDMVDTDIAENSEQYTTIDTPDPNIDFRRVKNLKIFFDRNAESLMTSLEKPEEWQAGDIVVFESHIAICSDKRNAKGIPFIIHHGVRSAREANNMENYTIVGHYRWNGEKYDK